MTRASLIALQTEGTQQEHQTVAALIFYDADYEDDPSYNARGTQMSRNQLAEQWYAYRVWSIPPSSLLEAPHTLNRNTSDAVLRKEFRL